MMRPEIITIGNVNTDIILGPQAPWPKPGTEVLLDNGEFREGGSAGNTAMVLRALGCRQRLLTNIGDDFMGRWLMDHFGDLAADWVISPCPTTFSVGITHPDDERTFFTSPGHVSELNRSHVEAPLADATVEGALVLFCGAFLTPLLTGDYVELFSGLRARGGRIALDTGWPPEGWTSAVRTRTLSWLQHCDQLLFNEVELCGLTECGAEEHELEAGCRTLLTHMPEGATVVVKRGPDGAMAVSAAHGVAGAAGIPVTVVDTIGAGDCFNAGYLLALVRGAGLGEALEVGVKVATSAISSSPRTYCGMDMPDVTSPKIQHPASLRAKT